MVTVVLVVYPVVVTLLSSNSINGYVSSIVIVTRGRDIVVGLSKDQGGKINVHGG